jgi:hypothetical protein
MRLSRPDVSTRIVTGIVTGLIISFYPDYRKSQQVFCIKGDIFQIYLNPGA